MKKYKESVKCVLISLFCVFLLGSIANAQNKSTSKAANDFDLNSDAINAIILKSKPLKPKVVIVDDSTEESADLSKVSKKANSQSSAVSRASKQSASSSKSNTAGMDIPPYLVILNSTKYKVTFYIRLFDKPWEKTFLDGEDDQTYFKKDRIIIKTSKTVEVHYVIQLGKRYKIFWDGLKWDLVELVRKK